MMDENLGSDTFDLAIIGYGPTGLALAYWLGKAGHKAVVIERWPNLYALPRAGHVDGEVMRLFQKMGVAEGIAGDSSIMKTSVIRGSDREEITRIYAEESDQGWKSRYSLYQPNLERTLDAIVRDTGHVTVLQGWQAENIETNGEGLIGILVASGVDNDGTWTPTGNQKTVMARWLIGADGANSVVRQAIQSRVQDLGYHARAVVIFAERLDPKIGAAMPDNEVGMFLPRPYVAFRESGKRFARWEFNVSDDETSSEMSTAAKAWELIGPWGFTQDNSRLVRHSVFEFRTQIVEDWRVGNIMLAGDAAHVMPPFQGQGMCSGQRDAAALAWRLDLVIRGIADTALLDSYTDERKPHVLELTKNSSERGQVFWSTDPVVMRERDARMKEGLVSENLKKRSGVVPALTSGLLMRANGEVVPPSGRLSAQYTVRRADREFLLDDLVGASWLLLSADRSLVDSLDVEERDLLRLLDVRVLILGRNEASDEIEDIEGNYARWLNNIGWQLLLIRPDSYIFGGANEAAGAHALFGSLKEQLHLKAEIA